MKKTAKIYIQDQVIECIIGVSEIERQQPQNAFVNIEVELDIDPARIDEKLEKTLCYSDLKNKVAELLIKGRFQLVETAAQSISDIIFSYPNVLASRVRVDKPDIFDDTDRVGFELMTVRQKDKS